MLQLAPRLVGPSGENLGPSGPVSYTSTPPGLVSVHESGLVTALAIGSPTIYGSTVHQGQALADTFGLTVAVTCTAELRVQVSPFDPVLMVGERFIPTLTMSTCGGKVTVTDVLTWSAHDPSIVSVHPVTGETVALRAGVTGVRAHGQRHGWVGSILVTVR